MREHKKKNILVTGAAGGLGSALARRLAGKAETLLLTDLDAEGLRSLQSTLSGHRVFCRVCDVTDEEAVASLGPWVRECCDGLDVLINNAGVGFSGGLERTSLQEWRRLMELNLYASIRHVDVFLPELRARAGQVVNISSGQAFFRLPSWGAYSVTKQALASYSDLLRGENEDAGVAVTTVFPFLINTGFYTGMRAESTLSSWAMKCMPWISMTPDQVAARVERSIARREPVELVSAVNHVGMLLQALPPLGRLWTRWGSRLMLQGVGR
ncbi:MAG: SDR family NAD(P)-dependent oxidoreductase [Myxococcota bacterium]|jgi:short-subunit dehydrogenase|nr:SDR family NAD(P)-dependent oxidoreductase [Myxococcota bacterium]